MKNQIITDIAAHDDVDFDQTIDSDEVVALAGGVAVNGDLDDSAVNTGVNTGIMAGDDVDLDHSTVGNGNTQISDSTVGAFSGRGDATNIQGENVNMGRGDLLDIDTDGGDAQVVNGNGNQTFGDIDVDADGGPGNFVFGSGNDANALEDNSTTIEDSFNTDNSVEDSFNTSVEDSGNFFSQDNDTETVSIDDSFNTELEDNDQFSLDATFSETDNSVFEDNDSFSLAADIEATDVDLEDSDFNDLDLG
ncbi:MAG: hypothetical protein IT196_04255 [Acidimicrobiales bacterium]|nr:hypothetical protein [Acidimicrobiales bacterium]